MIAGIACDQRRITDTIAWTNNDFVAHTATAKTDRGGAIWDVFIGPGKTEQLQVTQVGTMDYFCRFHPNMKARMIVLPK